jgi:tol-pal system protein YbgF
MDGSTMKSIVLINLIGLLLFWGCVSPKDVSSIDNRLSELEIRNAEAKKNTNNLQSDLQTRMEQEKSMRQQAAALRVKIDALSEEIRKMNGRIEELEYALGRQNQAKGTRLEELNASSKRNTERIDHLEQYLNLEPTTKVAVAPKPISKIAPESQIEVKKEPTEEEIYRNAKQAYDQGDLDTAKTKFQELIQNHPKSERADNAQFWIGEIYYREKWYEKAILEYQKVIENYPQGNKVPASLLKQGFAFLNLGDKANTRLIFEELVKKYPKSNEAKIARDKLQTLK